MSLVFSQQGALWLPNPPPPPPAPTPRCYHCGADPGLFHNHRWTCGCVKTYSCRTCPYPDGCPVCGCDEEYT